MIACGVVILSLGNADPRPAAIPVQPSTAPELAVPTPAVHEVVGPSGLELRFSYRGEPLPDVKATVLGDKEQALTSNADGVACVELDPGTYQWRLDSDLPISMKPQDTKTETETGIVNVSAPFTIEEGKTTIIELEQSSTRVFGRVLAPDGSPASDATLRLSNQIVDVVSDNNFNDRLKLERQEEQTDADGRFCFEDVLPSKPWTFQGQDRLTQKKIWIRWTKRNDVYFTTAIFTINNGEQKNLGDITFIERHQLTVHVPLTDVAGNPLRLDDVFIEPSEEEQPMEVMLTVYDKIPFDGSSDLKHQVRDTFQIPFGGEIVLNNLPGGPYELMIEQGTKWWPSLKEGWRLTDNIALGEAYIPSDTVVTMPLVVEHGVLLRVIVPTEGKVTGPLTVYLQPDGGTVSQKQSVQGMYINKEPAGITDFLTPPGNYTLYVTNNYIKAPQDALSFWSTTNVTLPEGGTTVTVPLDTGSSIQGIYLTRNNMPFKKEFIKFTDESGTFMFSTFTDETGKFVLNGVPPGWTLLAFSKLPVTVGSNITIRKDGFRQYTLLGRPKR